MSGKERCCDRSPILGIGRVALDASHWLGLASACLAQVDQRKAVGVITLARLSTQWKVHPELNTQPTSPKQSASHPNSSVTTGFCGAWNPGW